MKSKIGIHTSEFPRRSSYRIGLLGSFRYLPWWQSGETRSCCRAIENMPRAFRRTNFSSLGKMGGWKHIEKGGHDDKQINHQRRGIYDGIKRNRPTWFLINELPVMIVSATLRTPLMIAAHVNIVWGGMITAWAERKCYSKWAIPYKYS